MVGIGLAHSANGKKDSGAGCGGAGGSGGGVACRALQDKFGAVAITGGSGIYPRWGKSIS